MEKKLRLLTLPSLVPRCDVDGLVGIKPLTFFKPKGKVCLRIIHNPNINDFSQCEEYFS